MRRRDVIKLAGAPVAIAAVRTVLPANSTEEYSANGGSAPAFELRNDEFLLTLSAGTRLRCRLVHLTSGTVMADGDYSYSFGDPIFDPPHQASNSLTLVGKTGTGIGIQHQFSLDRNRKSLEEQITLTNLSSAPLDLHATRCGFVLPSADLQQTFSAVPFLREPGGPNQQYSAFSLTQILAQGFTSTLWDRWTVIPVPNPPTPEYASEGWVWRHSKQTFLLTKYSQLGMEWALLDRVPLKAQQSALRWGGAGIYRGHPEAAAWLAPGSSYQFGVTRLTAVAGDRTQAFYAFRAQMAERGHECPKGFDPPVHWNELYDNKLYWQPNSDDPEVRRKFYSLPDMKEEAAKAKAFGCEALYLDPGWDTNFGSKLWDSSRLGSFKSFTAMLESEYGLKCSLQTVLSGWCNPTSYAPETYRVDRFGVRSLWEAAFGTGPTPLPTYTPICGASTQYLEETAKRLKALAREGAGFLMFDGTKYQAECWDPNHGHAVPARAEEHANATVQLARLVHQEYPNVSIEMHDLITGGYPGKYTPVYYGHGPCPEGSRRCEAASFDLVWAFELMWNPIGNLLSGQAIALYYYNLAYSLPLYVHIDLRTDNENALVFWWNASTCRYLGIGGTHPNPAVVNAQKLAMKTYMRLKQHFTAGVFYGIDEMTHVHSSPDGNSAVINCFNLEERPVTREIRFEPTELGLADRPTYRFSGGAFRQDGRAYIGTVNIPARGHSLIEIR